MRVENNLNNETSFNEEFCTQLEYRLCRFFQNSTLENIKQLWCDGISHIPMLDTQRATEIVYDRQKIVTKAWIGKNGQTEYEMTIYLGKQALSRYVKGHSLMDCIPSEESID